MLDLADGRPVPGVRVRARDGAHVALAETDADGSVTLPKSGGSRVELDDPRWTALPSARSDPLVTGTLWVHGWIEVEGVVRVRGDAEGFDARKITLKVLLDPRGAPDLPKPSERQSSYETCRFLPPPCADGAFAATLPRVHGVSIAASPPSTKSAHRTIEVSGGVERTDVELWLDPAFQVSGALRSSGGRPLQGVSVTAYSAVDLTGTGISLEDAQLLQPEGGFTASMNQVTGRSRATFMYEARTGSDGRFELTVKVPGEVLLVAHEFGHRPAEADLGLIGRDLAGIDLSAEKVASPAFVRILTHGKPLREASVLVANLSLKEGDVQAGGMVRTDADGQMSTDWLLPGRRYFFHYAGLCGHVVWSDPETLDLARDLRPVSELPSR
ncbi:MAG: hypothetical protein ACT4PV_06420 [Planctomycetaceae bacterium]